MNNLKSLAEVYKIEKMAVGNYNRDIARNRNLIRNYSGAGYLTMQQLEDNRAYWKNQRAKAFGRMNKARAALTAEMLRVEIQRIEYAA